MAESYYGFRYAWMDRNGPRRAAIIALLPVYLLIGVAAGVAKMCEGIYEAIRSEWKYRPAPPADECL